MKRFILLIMLLLLLNICYAYNTTITHCTDEPTILVFSDNFDRADNIVVGNGWENVTTYPTSTVNISDNRATLHVFYDSATLKRETDFKKIDTSVAFYNASNSFLRLYDSDDTIIISIEAFDDVWKVYNDTTATNICYTQDHTNVTFIVEYINTSHFNATCINSSDYTTENTYINNDQNELDEKYFSSIGYSAGAGGNTRWLWVNNATFYSNSNVTTLNISYFDLNNQSINVNTSLFIEYYTNIPNINNFTNHSDNVSSVKFCIYPLNQSIISNIQIEYITPSVVSNYFTTNTNLSNITTYLNLYVTGGTTAVTATLYNNVNDKIEDGYIQVQEYDLGTNTYKTIGTYRTNAQGQTVIYLTLNSVYYRFLIYHPLDTLKKITTPTYIYSTGISFQINTQPEVLTPYYKSGDLDYTFEFNNVSNNFRFVYSDPSGDVSQACLNVYRTTTRGTDLINGTCLSAASGTLLAMIDPVNDTTYVGKAYVIIDGIQEHIDSVSVAFFNEEVLGFMGLFITFILTIVFAFVLFYDIHVGIILIPIPTLMMSGLGLLHLDLSIAIGLEIAALVLAFMVSRK